MPSPTAFLRSNVGKKTVMAVSGIILFGFVLGHMAGNLKMYQGPEALNAYAEGLRDFLYPILPHHGFLWIARIGLLTAVVLHIWSAWAVTVASRKARPVKYTKRDNVVATYASRTMRWGGVIILLFVIYHLLHLTTGDTHPDFVHGDVYHNVVTGLSVPWVAGFYLLANVFLGMHLYHGLWSMLQTLGWGEPTGNDWRRKFAATFAAVVTLGNLSFPIAVLTGVVA